MDHKQAQNKLSNLTSKAFKVSSLHKENPQRAKLEARRLIDEYIQLDREAEHTINMLTSIRNEIKSTLPAIKKFE